MFSPLNAEQELAVLELIRKIAGAEFPVTLSHQISGVGFLERENSTILNAALKKVMEKEFYQLQSICTRIGSCMPLVCHSK